MRKNIALILFVLVGCVVSAQETPIYQNEVYSLFPRKVVQGEYHANIVAPNALTSPFEGRNWLQHKGGVGYPAFSCGVPISNTLYNLSVDPAETTNLIHQYPDIAARLRLYLDAQHTPME